MKSSSFFDGVAFGTVISSVLILTCLWASDLPNAGFQGYFTSVLTTAATLAAGYLAVSAAARTIKAQSDQFEQIRQNKLEAAKSTLPLVLSLVTDISHAHLRHLSEGSQADQLPYLDTVSIATLKDCIENTTGVTRGTLRELISAYQICRSRHSEVRNFLPASQNEDLYECYIICKRATDWIALESLAAVLFDFSRGRAVQPIRDHALDLAMSQTEIFVYSANWLPSVRQDILERFKTQKAARVFSFANPGWLDAR